MPDAIFENPRLAEIYDDLEADRCDLDHYVAIAEQFGVRSVLAVLDETSARLAVLDETSAPPRFGRSVRRRSDRPR